jgi:hypothetical protein
MTMTINEVAAELFDRRLRCRAALEMRGFVIAKVAA